MASSSSGLNPSKSPSAPKKSMLPATDVQRFRKKLDEFLNSKDNEDRVIGAATWGVYAFYDFDGEPIYVGQTKESLRVRVRRHLTNQRTDAVAMRVLDVMEVSEVEIWPLWDLQTLGRINKKLAQSKLDEYEYSAYLNAIETSKFHAILNEKIPPRSNRVQLPSSHRGSVIDQQDIAFLGHPDIRIARRAETISRLADVIRERGEVSDGLRRVLTIQAIRLTHLSAERLAYAEGRPKPMASSIDSNQLLGSVLEETTDEPNLLESENPSD
ncbi:GIY-YIG nuclease family protein [Corynebacterium glutamicum]|uniref:GIY-YIG nuclease family protein n=1 Tax=Corynebacterium glutamicum TaxID=1718 RepID=UPI003B5C9E6C